MQYLNLFILFYILVIILYMSEKWKKSSLSCVILCHPHGLYSPWNSLGQNTGVGSHSLLQEILPTQGLNLGFLHYRQISYQLRHKESPRILEWVSYPFSREFSWPRNQTSVSYVAGGFFANWAIRGAQLNSSNRLKETMKDPENWKLSEQLSGV